MLKLTSVAMAALFLMVVSGPYAHAENSINTNSDITSYLLEKLNHHDLVLLGDVHQEPKLIETYIRLFPHLRDASVTHIALEIPSDQRVAIDHYLETGEGLEGIEMHSQIDCPEYRNFFEVLRSMPPDQRPLPVAIDLPVSEYDGMVNRDEYMAKALSDIFHDYPDAKALAILGNNHILKKLEWDEGVPNPHSSIREYLKETSPAIAVFSICQISKKSSNQCDFWEKYHSNDGTKTLELDRSFIGWQIGFVQNIAIKPAEVFEILDGVIVY